MKIKFLGGIHGNVTGSCTLLDYERTNTKFLVDCGLFQGGLHSEYENNKPFDFDPKEIKFVLLTHAHIDHCGLIPRLYSEGFNGKVICTTATKDLAICNLIDYSKISNLYDDTLINSIKFHLIDEGDDFSYGRSMIIDTDLRVSFSRNAHMLGSSSICINWKKDETQKNIVFSGDLGPNTKENPYQSLLAGCQLPYGYPDYMVIESTYGSKERDPQYRSFEERLKKLNNICDRAINERGGFLLIPSFSIHRAHELIADLAHIKIHNRKGLRNSEIIVDSPMITRTCSIYHTHLNKRQKRNKHEPLDRNKLFKEQFNCKDEDEADVMIAKIFGKHSKIIQHVDNNENSLDFERNEPKNCQVIVSSSGMCSGGRILQYLPSALLNDKATILITGYMAKGTLGAKLEELYEHQKNNKELSFDKIEIGDITIQADRIKAEIEYIAPYYSAHADQNDILDFVFKFKKDGFDQRPTNVFINHGDMNSTKALKESIEQYPRKGVNIREIKEVIIPTSEWYDLDKTSYSISFEMGPDKVDEFLEYLAQYKNYQDIVITKS